MTKITFIVPYTEKRELVQQIDRIVGESECPPNVVFEILHSKERIEDKFVYWDSDIVIARGLAYSVLKKGQRNFHLIEIPVSNMEILKAVKNTQSQYHAKHVALFLGKNVNIELELLEDLFQMQVDRYTVDNDDEVLEAFSRLEKRGGYDAVVGGYTACRIAAERGYAAVPFCIGEEAVRNGINEALSAIEASHREKQRNELLNRIIEMTEEGILALDSAGKILMVNGTCKRMLHLRQKNVISAQAEELVPDTVLSAREDGVIIKLEGRDVLVRRAPMMVDGEPDGTVLMLQYVENLQKAEIAVRQKLNQKGLVAKYDFRDIIGHSAPLQRVVEQAKRFAKTDSDILIIGESGTGKELLAQSIHNYSDRRKRPFVAFNCGAIAPNLIESELFGYVGGAFTGASREGKVGLFELAHKGTLFMDEIGELPLAMQASLLRVLQEKEIRRLGDDKIIPIDVRVIAATNVNIREKARTGEFREDLYYRLDVLHLQVPPLRSRTEDLEDLIPHLTRDYDCDGQPVVFEQGAIQRLKKLDWPGNVRQLRNVCQRLSLLSRTGVVTEREVETLIEETRWELHQAGEMESASEQGAAGESLTPEEQQLYELVRRKQTKAELAKKLGVSRSTLWRKTRDTKMKQN